MKSILRREEGERRRELGLPWAGSHYDITSSSYGWRINIEYIDTPWVDGGLKIMNGLCAGASQEMCPDQDGG